MPTVNAPVERICATCAHYGWKRGNPDGWRWVYCEAKKKWFPDNVEKPGELKGCEEWQ